MKFINKQPSISELKEFALMMSWAIPILFMLLLPWLFELAIVWWPALTTTILLTLYFIFPKGIKPIYKTWMFIAFVLGWVNTRILLSIIYYVVLFPIGLLLRLFGKLQYKNKEHNYKEHNNSGTYWKTRQIELKKDDLKRPF